MPIKRNPDKAVAAMARSGAAVARRAQPHHRRIGAAGPGRDPGRARRRAGWRRHRLRRRAAGRPGGSAGTALRRSRRASCSTGRLREAGIDRHQAYLTNAVKHFKYRAARQEAPAPLAHAGRDQALPLVARPGARLRASAPDRRPWRHRRAGPGRQGAADRAQPRPLPLRRAAAASSPCTPPICCACRTRRHAPMPTRRSSGT